MKNRKNIPPSHHSRHNNLHSSIILSQAEMRGKPVTLRDRVHFAGLRACSQLSPARPHGVPLHHCGQVLLIPLLLLRYLSFGNVLPMQERDGGGKESRGSDESKFPCSCFGHTHEAEKQ